MKSCELLRETHLSACRKGHVYIHTYVRTYIHACIHTYIHTYVYIYISVDIIKIISCVARGLGTPWKFENPTVPNGCPRKGWC